MRSSAIAVVLVVVAIGAIAAPAAADANNSTAGNATGPLDDVEVPDVNVNVGEDATETDSSGQDNATVPADSERIEPGLVLLDASYNPDSGLASLHFVVGSTRSVTLTDAGAFMEGGEVARRVEVLQSGRHTLKIPVTEVDGRVGVSVSTSETLYAVPIQSGAPSLFKGDPTWQSVQIGAGAGLGGALLIVGLIAYQRARGGRQEVKRVA